MKQSKETCGRALQPTLPRVVVGVFAIGFYPANLFGVPIRIGFGAAIITAIKLAIVRCFEVVFANRTNDRAES